MKLIRSLTLLTLCACLPACAQSFTLNDPTLVSSAPPASATALNTSLVSYWKLDEASGTRVDSEPTGTPQDLTDNNTVTSNPGIINTAAQFTAVNSEYLSHGDSADLSTGNIDFTWAAWVYLDAKGADRPILMKASGPGVTLEYGLRYHSSSDRFVFFVSSDTTSEVSVTANNFGSPSLSSWYLVIAWHDSVGDTINICVNNGTADTTAHAAGLSDTGSNFRIGRFGTVYWDGRIDEVGLWKKVLTAGERTELYNSGAGKTCCPF